MEPYTDLIYRNFPYLILAGGVVIIGLYILA
jgi:hypothetical protein